MNGCKCGTTKDWEFIDCYETTVDPYKSTPQVTTREFWVCNNCDHAMDIERTYSLTETVVTDIRPCGE